MILLAAVLHRFFSVAWLAEFFYVIYFLPGCVLALICLVGETCALTNSRSARFFSP